MRAGGRTRRRAVDAIVVLVVIALVVAVLTRARSNDPRRDETRRKSMPRRAGLERGAGGSDGEDAALRRAGTTGTRTGPGDGKRTVGGRGARLGDAETRVREPRGWGEEGGATKGALSSVALEAHAETRAAPDSRNADFFERRGGDAGRRGSRGRRWEDLDEVPWPVMRSERRRLADPGGGGDGDGGGDGGGFGGDASSLVAENAHSEAVAAGPDESCAAACGLCRASCCCDAECRAVGDCCADFEQPGMCVEQKAASLGGESGGSSEAPPPPPTATIAPPPDGFGFGFGSGTPPGGPNAPPAVPQTSFTWPPAPASSPPTRGHDDPSPAFPPPPPPEAPSAPTAAAGWSGPDAEATGDDGRDSLVDPRGTWHGDVRPPAPWYPSRPPAPFPPPPGVPPVPLGVYAKLQAVPQCSPFCGTRAPPPSLPRGDRRWPALVAAAAEKQWAQLRDLAQIQIGGSAVGGFAGFGGSGYHHARFVDGAAAVESGHESSRESGGGRAAGGAPGTSDDGFPAEADAFGPFFAQAQKGAELKRHARRFVSVER